MSNFFKKLIKGDWSNPFDNIKSSVRDVYGGITNPQNWLGNAKNFFSTAWDKTWGTASGLGYKGIGWLLGGGEMDLGSVVESLGPSAIDYYTQQEANAASAQEAARNRAFQEMMSSTAYQRAMADMAAAGLNPMLAYQQGGASTPGGSMASMNAARPGQTAIQASTAKSAIALQQAQIARTGAEIDNLRSSTQVNSAQAGYVDARRLQTIAETEGIPASIKETLARIELHNASAAAQLAGADLSGVRAALGRAQLPYEQLRGKVFSGVDIGAQLFGPTNLSNRFGVAVDALGELFDTGAGAVKSSAKSIDEGIQDFWKYLRGVDINLPRERRVP